MLIVKTDRATAEMIRNNVVEQEDEILWESARAEVDDRGIREEQEREDCIQDFLDAYDGSYGQDARRSVASWQAYDCNLFPEKIAERITGIDGVDDDEDYEHALFVESEDESSVFLFLVAAGFTVRYEACDA